MTATQPATCPDAIARLVALVGARDAVAAVRLGKRQNRLELYWARRLRKALAEATAALLAAAAETGRLNPDLVDFEAVLMEHAYSVMEAGISSVPAADARAPETTRLSAPPKDAAPKTLRALRRWWDAYRKSGKADPRQKALAAGLKKAFLAAVQKAWREEADDFLSGDTFRNTEAVAAIARRADVAYARAKMIVATGTTYHFNKVRREIYDQSPDVSHYLFVAIRDHVTTKWCKTRQGLVYAKGDPLLEKETPPIHWNCRSELLPLTRHNPNHLRLIEDAERQRRNHSPEPLPVGWTGRRKAS